MSSSSVHSDDTIGEFEWKVYDDDGKSMFCKFNNYISRSEIFNVDDSLTDCFLSLKRASEDGKLSNDKPSELQIWLYVQQMKNVVYRRLHFFINGTHNQSFTHDDSYSGEFKVLRVPYKKLFTRRGTDEVKEGVIKVRWIRRMICVENVDAFVPLNRNFETLLNSGEFSDVVIRSGNFSQFPSHQNVICTWSPVFRAMMATDMRESKRRCIDIADFSEVAVRNMLNHMYRGLLPLWYDYDMAVELLKLADKYDLQVLKYEYAESLLCRLDSSNAAELLLLADASGNDRLKSEVLQFISERRVEFSKETAFVGLKLYPELLLCIISVLAKPCEVLIP